MKKLQLASLQKNGINYIMA